MKHIWTRLGAAVLCAGLLLGMLPMPAAAKGSGSVSPDAARALAQVLQEQLGLYGQGALEEGPSVWAKNDGLLYAEAADFDLDGSTELILTRVDDSCPTLEVYRASGKRLPADPFPEILGSAAVSTSIMWDCTGPPTDAHICTKPGGPCGRAGRPRT